MNTVHLGSEGSTSTAPASTSKCVLCLFHCIHTSPSLRGTLHAASRLSDACWAMSAAKHRTASIPASALHLPRCVSGPQASHTPAMQAAHSSAATGILRSSCLEVTGCSGNAKAGEVACWPLPSLYWYCSPTLNTPSWQPGQAARTAVSRIQSVYISPNGALKVFTLCTAGIPRESPHRTAQWAHPETAQLLPPGRAVPLALSRSPGCCSVAQTLGQQTKPDGIYQGLSIPPGLRMPSPAASAAGGRRRPEQQLPQRRRETPLGGGKVALYRLRAARHGARVPHPHLHDLRSGRKQKTVCMNVCLA